MLLNELEHELVFSLFGLHVCCSDDEGVDFYSGVCGYFSHIKQYRSNMHIIIWCKKLENKETAQTYSHDTLHSKCT